MRRLLSMAAAGAAALMLLPASLRAVPAALSAEDILARTRATYAALRTYSDTGTVMMEYGPPGGIIRERHTFKTAFRAPRHFLFDFTEDASAGGERFVVWSDDEAFRTWWSTTGAAETYPKGRGTAAFVAGDLPTKGALMQIAPLLFAGAGLAGTLTELGAVTDAGVQTIAGRRCHTLKGVASSTYAASGHVVDTRAVTVWIDAETMLVRQVFEDPPPGGGGFINRTTYTFVPQGNPPLDNAVFLFTPPK